MSKRYWENPEGCGGIVASIGPLRCGVNTMELCPECRRARAPTPPHFHDAACKCRECQWIIEGEGLWFFTGTRLFGPLDDAMYRDPRKVAAFVSIALPKAQAKIDAKFGQDPAERERRHEAWLKWWRSW